MAARNPSVEQVSVQNFQVFCFESGFKIYLTTWFPLRPISAFRPLARDRARLRARRISWIVSKRRASVFIIYLLIDLGG